MANAKRYIGAAFLIAAVWVFGDAQGSVVIGGTRIIYPAQDKEVSVKLSNEGKIPALVEFWLDDGDEKSTPDTAKVPFTVMPPIFRIDGGKAQTVRIALVGAPLTADKETLFWINALEIPPKPANTTDRNFLQFAFRTRIKLIYRPEHLPGDVASAPAKLICMWAPGESGKNTALQVKNPTPYYVNFAHVGIEASGQDMPADGRGGMVAPGGVALFSVPSAKAGMHGAQASLSVIDDYGAISSVLCPVQ